MARADGHETLAVSPWEVDRYLKRRDSFQARLTRGFLCCEPQKWFPGFAMQWLPLIHSLGAEVKIAAVEPSLDVPASWTNGYLARVDDDAMLVLVEPESREVFLEAFCPGYLQKAGGVLEEYLARRLLTSLVMSWSGPESSSVVYAGECDLDSAHVVAGVRIDLSVNRHPCSFWILLGIFLVERLDGLWKRQLRSTARQGVSAMDLALEVAQLAVPPSLLADYMKPRAVIDLETPVSDRLLLRDKGSAWSLARMHNLDGKLGFELLDDAIPTPRLPEGTTRLTIEFGLEQLEPVAISELTQHGAIWETGIELDGHVNISINGEKVADADLMVYEGRFAIRVR